MQEGQAVTAELNYADADGVVQNVTKNFSAGTHTINISWNPLMQETPSPLKLRIGELPEETFYTTSDGTTVSYSAAVTSVEQNQPAILLTRGSLKQPKGLTLKLTSADATE